MSECYIKEKLSIANSNDYLYTVKCNRCDGTHVGWIPEKIFKEIQDEIDNVTGRLLEIYLNTI